MSAREDAVKLLPENFDGWDCDGSASVCDKRLDALRALLAETEPEWEYGVRTWETDRTYAFFVCRDHEDATRHLPGGAKILRRRKAGPWEEVTE